MNAQEKLRSVGILGVGLACLMWATVASGGFVPIAFQYNVSSENRTPLYPEGDLALGSVFVNGVPGQTVPFAIPVTGNNEWTGPGQHHMPDSSYSGWYTLDIPVHLSGIHSAMTLTNQHWWAGEARLEFLDAAGSIRHTELLVANRDIRDWNTQTGGMIDPNCAQEVVRVSPGPFDGYPCVMDMQVHELPEYFWAEGNELAAIRVVDYAEWMSHQLILSGVTVSDDLVVLPEPGVVCLLIPGALLTASRYSRFVRGLPAKVT